AAVRAITRCSLDLGWEVLGVKCGYAGLIAGDFQPLSLRSVAGIIRIGGTFLGSARSPEFRTEEGRKQALANLREAGADALIVIGGNGSQAGGASLAQLGFPVVGVASTIDNDLVGSDITIGVDTALNIALESIDRLTTTASSHHRAFLVEVMGRGCGYIALMTAIAGGAEVVVIPEIETTPEEVAAELAGAYERGKLHAIAVVAEGAKYNAEALVSYFREHEARIGFELRATMLGHVQRGGDPTAYDRLLATRLGAGAVEALARGESGVLTGMIKGEVATTPYAEVVDRVKSVDERLWKLAHVLAR
ncbi:MAG: 6-phosphofructokinase, partial [Thermomicrobiales bacterium]|nr:6-phosphofructokinase [Thermomicrobiales bacterium]